MRKRKVRVDGTLKAEPKRCSTGLLGKPVSDKVDMKLKKAAERNEASHKKVQVKEKREAKDKQPEGFDQQITDLPAENRETENQITASEEEEEAKSN